MPRHHTDTTAGPPTGSLHSFPVVFPAVPSITFSSMKSTSPLSPISSRTHFSVMTTSPLLLARFSAQEKAALINVEVHSRAFTCRDEMPWRAACRADAPGVQFDIDQCSFLLASKTRHRRRTAKSRCEPWTAENRKRYETAVGL